MSENHKSFLETADAWAEEYNRKLANGEDPSEGVPEPHEYILPPDAPYRRIIELFWEAIDALNGYTDPDNDLHDMTVTNVNVAYFHILAAERRRLLEGPLKGVDVSVLDDFDGDTPV